MRSLCQVCKEKPFLSTNYSQPNKNNLILLIAFKKCSILKDNEDYIMNMNLTTHAYSRIRQRGIRDSDLSFILSNGTARRKGFMITKKDRDRIICEAKNAISRAEKLEGKLIISDADVIITAFHGTKKQTSRFASDM